jgi:hypothetical protein
MLVSGIDQQASTIGVAATLLDSASTKPRDTAASTPGESARPVLRPPLLAVK